MDAIIMPSTRSLIQKLKSDFVQFTFVLSDNNVWSPSENTIYYTNDNKSMQYFFHELSHAILGHVDYRSDVQLIAMERAAWERARSVARIYGSAIEDDIVEDNLDTYRDWLHARSTCPACQATGMQQTEHTYTCVACSHEWNVNDARVCGLKRTVVKRPHMT